MVLELKSNILFTFFAVSALATIVDKSLPNEALVDNKFAYCTAYEQGYHCGVEVGDYGNPHWSKGGKQLSYFTMTPTNFTKVPANIEDDLAFAIALFDIASGTKAWHEFGNDLTTGDARERLMKFRETGEDVPEQPSTMRLLVSQFINAGWIKSASDAITGAALTALDYVGVHQ